MSDNMVLRTVFLPPDLDQQLKVAAIRDQRSKNDIIRELIMTGLQDKLKGGDPRFTEPRAGAPVSVDSPVRTVTAKAAKRPARRRK